MFVDYVRRSVVHWVTSHLATRKTRHQQTRHQYEISILLNPNLIRYFPRLNYYFDRSVGAFPGFQNVSKFDPH